MYVVSDVESRRGCLVADIHRVYLSQVLDDWAGVGTRLELG